MSFKNINNRCLPQRGFTLIELMITVTILAILLALAVPAYTDYAIRSKVAECINGAAVAKIQISEFRQSLGAWPPNETDAGIASPAGDSFYCDGFIGYVPGTGAFSVSVDENTVNPSTIGEIQPTLTPTASSNGIIEWACTRGGTAPDNYKYLPATCRSS